MIKTFLADDHKVFCDGLERLLSESSHFQVLGKFHTGQSLLESTLSSADLLIMDIEMPGMNGLDVIKRIQLNNAALKIVMLSMHDETIYVREAHLQGAVAYLNKSIESELLINYLLRIYNGERIFPEIKIAEKHKSILSEREEEILKWVARGWTSEVIAEKLGISHLTVKAHRRNISRKLKVKNSSALIVKAIERGLL